MTTRKRPGPARPDAFAAGRYRVGPGTVEGTAAAFVPMIVRWTLTPDKS